jgi:hypothetical protein
MPAQTNPTSLSLSGGLEIFTFTGDPNQAVVGPRDAHYPQAPGTNESLALCSLGSVCIDPSTGMHWHKAAQPGAPGAGPTGIWVSGSPWEIAGTTPAPATAGRVTPTAGSGQVQPVTGKPPAPVAQKSAPTTTHTGATGARHK